VASRPGSVWSPYSLWFTIVGDTTRSYSPSASFSADAISVGDDAVHPPISDVIPSEVSGSLDVLSMEDASGTNLQSRVVSPWSTNGFNCRRLGVRNRAPPGHRVERPRTKDTNRHSRPQASAQGLSALRASLLSLFLSPADTWSLKPCPLPLTPHRRCTPGEGSELPRYFPISSRLACTESSSARAWATRSRAVGSGCANLTLSQRSLSVFCNSRRS
jgi:hypothetical protein